MWAMPAFSSRLLTLQLTGNYLFQLKFYKNGFLRNWGRWQRDAFLSVWKNRQAWLFCQTVVSREATTGPRCKSQKAPSCCATCFRKRDICKRIFEPREREVLRIASSGKEENNLLMADMTQKVEMMIVLNFYRHSWTCVCLCVCENNCLELWWKHWRVWTYCL